ncbi:hypothetical protein EDB83DRAFT_2315705 [Lactarius deliciosus]|nr:hypothetical protein EDB83DRAFT_2315705 [Lactarius deliciosus]
MAKTPFRFIPTRECHNTQTIREPKFDEYFLHDYAVCELRHNMTYLLEKRCANLGTIDLQSLLYEYEVDIATAISEVFEELELDEDFDLAPLPPSVEVDANLHRECSLAHPQTSAEWFACADFRQDMIDQTHQRDLHQWNEQQPGSQGLAADFDVYLKGLSRRRQGAIQKEDTHGPRRCAAAALEILRDEYNTAHPSIFYHIFHLWRQWYYDPFPILSGKVVQDAERRDDAALLTKVLVYVERIHGDVEKTCTSSAQDRHIPIRLYRGISDCLPHIPYHTMDVFREVYDTTRSTLLHFRDTFRALPEEKEAIEGWVKSFSSMLGSLVSLGASEALKIDPLVDPEIEAFIHEIRGRHYQFITAEWIDHSPHVVAGIEDRLRQRAAKDAEASARARAATLLALQEPSSEAQARTARSLTTAAFNVSALLSTSPSPLLSAGASTHPAGSPQDTRPTPSPSAHPVPLDSGPPSTGSSVFDVGSDIQRQPSTHLIRQASARASSAWAAGPESSPVTRAGSKRGLSPGDDSQKTERSNRCDNCLKTHQRCVVIGDQLDRCLQCRSQDIPCERTATGTANASGSHSDMVLSPSQLQTSGVDSFLSNLSRAHTRIEDVVLAGICSGQIARAQAQIKDGMAQLKNAKTQYGIVMARLGKDDVTSQPKRVQANQTSRGRGRGKAKRKAHEVEDGDNVSV